MAIIEIKQLRKSFKKSGIFNKTFKQILKGITLNVEQETFGFIGPNGAGKTTTIKLMMGFLKPDSGTVSILGKNINNAKQSIGFLPEKPYIYSSIKAIEYLNFCCDIFNIPYYERKKLIGNLLELVNLTGREEESISSYSKGMVQRLLFAATLINDPKVLILDEPMSGLDPLGRATISNVINTLREQGKTIFYSSHIIQDVERLSDRVAIIIDGEIKLEGSVAEIVSKFLKGYSITYRSNGRLRTVETTKETFWQKLEDLKRAKAEIITVEPLRLSLEDIFVKLVKGENIESYSVS